MTRRWTRWLIRRSCGLVILTLFGGGAFTLFLQTSVQGPVFTNGDAALKFLLTRQFAAGQARLDLALELEAEPWVRQVWDEGLFPLEYPNVVEKDGKRYAVFPFAFPLLSAAPYRLFGFRGLYFIPLLATWWIWLSFVRACRRLRLGGVVTAAALALLVLGSPLTFYSVSFWEHALAVALCFHGLVAVLAPPPGRPLSRIGGITAGVCVGLAPLFREELYVVSGLAAAGAVLVRLAPRLQSHRHHHHHHHRGTVTPFLTGLLVGLASVFVVNLAAYGHVLGLHAVTALKSDAWAQAFKATRALRFLTWSLFEFFPITLFALVAVPVAWFKTRRSGLERALLLLGLCAVIVVATPVLVRSRGGHQWGPRYLLIVVPLLALAAGQALRALLCTRGTALRYATVAGFVVLGLKGIGLNTSGATRYLFSNYERRMQPLRAVRQAAPRVVAVNTGSVTLGLAGLVGEKVFVLTEKARHLRRLGRAMAAVGEHRFLYVCYPRKPCGRFQEGPARVTFYRAGTDRRLIEFVRLGRRDRYLLYEARVVPPPAGMSPPTPGHAATKG